ncbi:MAG: hypothetical protein WBA07_27505 [Rivularia sp. (in: cyanobacteria)]
MQSTTSKGDELFARIIFVPLTKQWAIANGCCCLSYRSNGHRELK